MGIAAYKLPSRVLRFLALTVFVVSILPARAQEPFIHSSDFYVTTSDNVSIHVHRKVASFDQFNFAFKRVPVLLIHGTWVDGRVWDFPGRSVMDHLAVQGYDVYALDLRGIAPCGCPPKRLIARALGQVRGDIAPGHAARAEHHYIEIARVHARHDTALPLTRRARGGGGRTSSSRARPRGVHVRA